MHVIQYSHRIYISLFLCLCAAFLFAPTVAIAADIPTTLRPDLQDLVREVRKEIGSNVNRPSNTSLSTSSSAPTISKNPTGGLSATTNNILRNMGQPSTFNSTSNYSLNSAKNALKSCVRSPSCAGRTLGGGAIIYEGIQGWKDVYDFVYDDTDNQIKKKDPKPYMYDPSAPPESPSSLPSGVVILSYGNANPSSVLVIEKDEFGRDNPTRDLYCNTSHPIGPFLGSVWPAPSPGQVCVYYDASLGDPVPYPPERLEPVSPEELDNAIDEGYEPAVTDAPIVITGGGSPESIELSTPAPVQLPSTSKTITDSNGQTSTAVTNRTITYNVTNNNTAKPNISSTITETTNTYDNSGNLTQTETNTTTEQGVEPEAPAPSSPTAGASADFELPVFCTWAKPLCDWLGWTQEELGEEEPDLSQLIRVFEPDEEGFDVGIGSGSCPAPMQLNLGIISKTVEVKYDPFCSFLEMIRPFVLAAAYLFAAYLYVGVLRRG